MPVFKTGALSLSTTLPFRTRQEVAKDHGRFSFIYVDGTRLVPFVGCYLHPPFFLPIGLTSK